MENEAQESERARKGGRILGKKDGEMVCAVLIRLWGQRWKDWGEAVCYSKADNTLTHNHK